MTDDIHLDAAAFSHAIRGDALARLRSGRIAVGDLGRLARLLRCDLDALAVSMAVQVEQVVAWDQGTSAPDGPALVLIKLLATRPSVVLRQAKPAA